MVPPVAFVVAVVEAVDHNRVLHEVLCPLDVMVNRHAHHSALEEHLVVAVADPYNEMVAEDHIVDDRDMGNIDDRVVVRDGRHIVVHNMVNVVDRQHWQTHRNRDGLPYLDVMAFLDVVPYAEAYYDATVESERMDDVVDREQLVPEMAQQMVPIHEEVAVVVETQLVVAEVMVVA